MRRKITIIGMSMAVLLAAGSLTMSGQIYHFQEGFADTPEGWTLTNTFLTGSSSNVNNLYPGEKAVKMKGVSSTVQTAAYETADSLYYWILPKAEGTSLKVEYSFNDGTDWTLLEDFQPTAGELDSYQDRKLEIKNEGIVIIRFTATGGADGDGIFYLDDVALTKLPAADDDASLAEIRVNGELVSKFKADSMWYASSLFYTEEVVVTAVANNPEATVDITQPTDIFGDSIARTAVINVSSKDGSTSLSYAVTVSISYYLMQNGFVSTGENIFGFPGWELLYTWTSTNIGGPGNHGDYEGEAALKFIRGQPNKQGGMISPKLTNVGTLSFWLYIADQDSAATLKITTQTGFAPAQDLATITDTDLSDSEWTMFSYDINAADSTVISFTPTLSVDGSTRIWMDDMAITPDHVVGIDPPTFASELLKVYPNPATDVVYIEAVESQPYNASIYSITGQKVRTFQLKDHVQTVPIGDLNSGMYVILVECDSGSLTAKFIKE